MLQFLSKSVWSSRVAGGCNQIPVRVGQVWQVADTLRPSLSLVTDSSGEMEVLKLLSWVPGSFPVTVSDIGEADFAIDFPSPLPQANPDWDTVTMDWHFARDKSGKIRAAPAVVVLDILQGGNRVAGYIARTLAKNGVHSFVLHLPQNGRRVVAGGTHDWAAFLPSLRQAAADARRARDVIASLPLVTGGISIQGCSLGGFIATIAGSMDNAFDSVILAVTGGDVFDVLTRGKIDAARVRKHLLNVGYDDAKLRDWLWQIEPLRIAHRLDPKKTWLFTARYDQVVARRNSQKLAKTIGLDWSHQRQLTGCHYSCAINARRFLSEMIRIVQRPQAHHHLSPTFRKSPFATLSVA